MSTLSGYYSGDLTAACAAHRAHVRRGDVRRPAEGPPRRPRVVEGAAYRHYDGDLDALLAALC